MSTETPFLQSSARIPERAIEDDSRKQLEFLVLHQNVDVHDNNIQFALRRDGEDGQHLTFSDVHLIWIKWFKRRKADY